MGYIFLTAIVLSGFYILPTYSGHLPYFNNRVSPSRVVAKQSYWYTHGSHASSFHPNEKFAKWHHHSSNRPVPYPRWNKIPSPQYAAVAPSFASVVQTTTYQPPSQHTTRASKPERSSDLSTLIHQLQQKLHQVEQQLAESGSPKQNEPLKAVTEVTDSESDPKQIEATDNDPFWIELDVVNKQLGPERLIKTIKVLLDNLKESTTPPVDHSEENVYNLIDIRSSFAK